MLVDREHAPARQRRGDGDGVQAGAGAVVDDGLVAAQVEEGDDVLGGQLDESLGVLQPVGVTGSNFSATGAGYLTQRVYLRKASRARSTASREPMSVAGLFLEAVAHLERDEQDADAVERRLGRGELGEDLLARAALFDHALQAACLALDPAQPVDETTGLSYPRRAPPRLKYTPRGDLAARSRTGAERRAPPQRPWPAVGALRRARCADDWPAARRRRPSSSSSGIGRPPSARPMLTLGFMAPWKSEPPVGARP